MRLLLDNMHLNELKQFKLLDNSSSKFKLFTTLSSHSMACIKCNEHRDYMIDFQTFVKQRFNVKGTILLDNKIIIGSNKYLKCSSSGSSRKIKMINLGNC
jgi:hypothetical protein